MSAATAVSSVFILNSLTSHFRFAKTLRLQNIACHLWLTRFLIFCSFCLPTVILPNKSYQYHQSCFIQSYCIKTTQTIKTCLVSDHSMTIDYFICTSLMFYEDISATINPLQIEDLGRSKQYKPCLLYNELVK